MIRSIERFFHTTRTSWFNVALLGGAIGLAPALGLADDKDKRNKSGETHHKPTTMSAQGTGGVTKQIDSPAKTSGKSSSKSQVATGATPLQLQGKLNGGTKAIKSSEIKGSDRHPDLTGKTRINPIELKGENPPLEPPTRLSDKTSKKTFKPHDLDGLKLPSDLSSPLSDSKNKGKSKQTDVKGRNVQPESHAKNMDLGGKKSVQPGDIRFAKNDSKNDGPKKAGNFLELHKAGKFDGVMKGAVAKKVDLSKQFELKHKGDLALKLNLANKMKMHGGWSKAHCAGLIGPGFGIGCSPIAYCGPWYFPSHCMYPAWHPWVEFCWGFHCEPICDPRPWFCRPWWYDPCPVWTCWDYPSWYELPVVVCGTWVDVEPVVIAEDGLDLQLLAVRFVDPGHPELREGPRLRVWARNNSARTIIRDFNVLLMASNSREVASELPQSGVRVDSMEPGEIKALDIRLPFEANTMGRDADGNAIPFSQLHVLVDSHREIPEVFEENNGAVIARGDILPVDPAIFGSDSMTPLAGSELNIAGEGFGPEPGQVLVHVGGIELQAEIEGWYDLGVRVKLPSLALASPTDAQLIVIRGDTAASNPLTIQLAMPVASR